MPRTSAFASPETFAFQGFLHWRDFGSLDSRESRATPGIHRPPAPNPRELIGHRLRHHAHQRSHDGNRKPQPPSFCKRPDTRHKQEATVAHSEADIEYMRRAIELARRGTGFTNPNPLVGAVLVRDGEIIAEGWHARCGDLHAERAALANCRARNISPEGATLYVTLEPCCHTGKQPPCHRSRHRVGHRTRRRRVGRPQSACRRTRLRTTSRSSASPSTRASRKRNAMPSTPSSSISSRTARLTSR